VFISTDHQGDIVYFTVCSLFWREFWIVYFHSGRGIHFIRGLLTSIVRYDANFLIHHNKSQSLYSIGQLMELRFVTSNNSISGNRITFLFTSFHKNNFKNPNS